MYLDASKADSHRDRMKSTTPKRSTTDRLTGRSIRVGSRERIAHRQPSMDTYRIPVRVGPYGTANSDSATGVTHESITGVSLDVAHSTRPERCEKTVRRYSWADCVRDLSIKVHSAKTRTNSSSHHIRNLPFCIALHRSGYFSLRDLSLLAIARQ
jgi:hypothetical protein